MYCRLNLNNLYVIIQRTMSPRKSEENLMIMFRKSQGKQKQSFADVLRNRCS